MAVEAPVLRMVDRLLPGVTTLTYIARYFALYWALADYADQHDLDTENCRLLVRRTEVALGLLSLFDQQTRTFDGPGGLHGADRIKRAINEGTVGNLTTDGSGSYSPRPWGFWSQYGGASVALGSVVVEKRALRRGSTPCPQQLRDSFRPLLEACSRGPLDLDGCAQFVDLGGFVPTKDEAMHLRSLLVPHKNSVGEYTGDAQARRVAFQLVARSVQLTGGQPGRSFTNMAQETVAFGGHVSSDPVLGAAEQVQGWRGTLLRHYSVGAWRRLWSALVDHIREEVEPCDSEDIHRWVRKNVGDMSLQDFISGLPATVNGHNEISNAEESLDFAMGWKQNIALLLIGAKRTDELDGLAKRAFLGGGNRQQFLDPVWIAHRRDEYIDRTLAEFACALTDDMVSQSKRVALRKMTSRDGHFVMFTKLHEREGRYFASGLEGRGNVGVRLEQVGQLSLQLGLIVQNSDGSLKVSRMGRETLGLPL